VDGGTGSARAEVLVPHRYLGNWQAENFPDISDRTLREYRQIARKWQRAADLPASKDEALRIIRQDKQSTTANSSDAKPKWGADVYLKRLNDFETKTRELSDGMKDVPRARRVKMGDDMQRPVKTINTVHAGLSPRSGCEVALESFRDAFQGLEDFDRPEVVKRFFDMQQELGIKAP
jgi:hypothetical protein